MLDVAIDKGGYVIWFGSQNGAALKDGARFIKQVTPHPNVHVVAQLGSSLLIGTEGGLLVSDPEKSDFANESVRS